MSRTLTQTLLIYKSPGINCQCRKYSTCVKEPKATLENLKTVLFKLLFCCDTALAATSDLLFNWKLDPVEHMVEQTRIKSSP